ncbi:MAG TPA: hypothetical protein VI461_12485, partial [Chitinophagaceae bacterium]|nr:hypothetical protein [Chitinophagaceae bacterium]
LLREFWGNKFDEFPDDLFLLIGERMGWSRLNNLIISIAAFALEDNRDDPAKTFTVGPTVNINGQDVVLIPGKILRRVPIMEGQVFAAGNIF